MQGPTIESFARQTLDLSSFIDLDAPMAALPCDEDALEERRMISVSFCGQWKGKPHPGTGIWYKYLQNCKYWRLCPRCLDHRALEFRTRYTIARDQVGDTLQALECTKKESTALVRKLRKVGISYWRIPTEGGSTILFDNTFFPEITGNLDCEGINWHNLCQTPERTRYSGHLGEIEEEKELEEDKGIMIEIPALDFVCDMSHEDIFEEATLLTRDLDPDYDEDELSWAHDQRAEAIKQVVEEQGGEILRETSYRVRVSVSSYKRWKIACEHIVTRAEKRITTAPSAPSQGFSLPAALSKQAMDELYIF